MTQFSLSFVRYRDTGFCGSKFSEGEKMMKKFAVLAVLLGVFVSYQNCAPNSSSLNATPAELTSQIPSSYNKIPVQNFQTLSVWDAAHMQFLDVNLTSGKIAAFSDAGQTAGGNYCLTPAKLQAVQAILSSAVICVPVVDPQQLANQVCAMDYTYPYANLIGSGSVQYHLGEKSDSCEAPTDLCGNAAGNLKSWSNDLLANLASFACQ